MTRRRQWRPRPRSPSRSVRAAAPSGPSHRSGASTGRTCSSAARVWTLSFGLAAVFLVLGVWALFIVPGVVRGSDDEGIRWGLAALAPYWIIGGALMASASRHVAKDAAAALRSLAATVDMR